MNVGTSYLSEALTRQFSSLQAETARSQSMLATGRRFIEASESPDEARAVQKMSMARLSLSGDSNRRDLAMRLVETSQSLAQQASSLFESATAAFEEAFGPGKDSVYRESFAKQIDELIAQGAAFLNQEQDGRYLYGGTETSHPPFAFERNESGQILSVSYVGNEERSDFPVGLDIRMDPAPDPSTNGLWADWMNRLLDAKNRIVEGDVTAAKESLRVAKTAGEAAGAATTDLVGKAVRLDALNSWSTQADAHLADSEAKLQEIDANAVALQFNELQRNYEASLQSGRLLLSLSLIDFL